MAEMQNYRQPEDDEELPLAVKNPSPELMAAMIKAFVQKKKERGVLDVVHVPQKKVEVTKKNSFGRGGRPRLNFMKTVTMVRASKNTKRLVLAGRGRPKEGVRRFKIDVPHNCQVCKGTEYNLVKGELVKAR